MSKSSIWPIDRSLSGDTTPGQSEPGSDGNKRVFCIPQTSGITGTSLSDFFFNVISRPLDGGILSFCRDEVGIFHKSTRLGYFFYCFFFFFFICNFIDLHMFLKRLSS